MVLCTFSNIYNYFNSKDELFRHIVKPLLTELERMMREHHNVEEQDDFICYATGQRNGMVGDHVKEYMLLINNHRDELKLLLYQSQGSSLEKYRHLHGRVHQDGPGVYGRV